MIFLDTHVVVWLYAGEVERFPKKARNRLERQMLVISPMVQLEIQYLHEIGRLLDTPATVFKELAKSLGLSVSDENFERVIRASLRENWTRDPFDRIIVAQAGLESTPLLTRDETIRKHYHHAFWG